MGQVASAATDSWRLRLLNRGSLVLSVLVLIFVVAFGSRLPSQGPFIWAPTILLWLSALRRFPYWVRGTFLLAALAVASFISALRFGLSPGTLMWGLCMVISAGLLVSARAALIVWAASGVLISSGLYLSVHGYGHFDAQQMDPARPEVLARFIWTYLSGSLLLAVGTMVVVERLARSVRELSAALEAERSARLALLQSEQERTLAERGKEAVMSRIVEAQKFEIMAQLAGSVAHDVNNSLQVILAQAEYELGEENLADETRESLQEIVEVCNEASYTARQLLTLGEQVVLDLRVLDITDVVRKLGRALNKFLGMGVTLQLQIEPDLLVEADAVQLKQALLNLVINANHAMPRGGVLTIKASRKDDTWVELSVSDTGIGMDESTQAHVFEPFFSTKGSGGSGLGLPTVRAICKTHGGSLQLQSQLGKGSTFTMRLPSVSADAWESSPSLPSVVRLDGVNILHVDDDVRVRRAVSRVLEGAGARVLVAQNAEQALEIAQSERIDVLCTDARMPGMSLSEFIAAFSVRHADAAVVVLSAFVNDEIVRKSLTQKHFDYLAKPCTSRELLAKIHRAARSEHSAESLSRFKVQAAAAGG